MKLEDIRPGDCYARAQRLLFESGLICTELGRGEDPRPLFEVSDAQPRECYFEALASWHKAARLASEVGASASRFTHGAANLRELRPGHVLAVLDEVLAILEGVKQRLAIGDRGGDPVGDPGRQPSDVLQTLVRVNRELSRALERPFTPA